MKLTVTHRGRLLEKYGPTGLAAIDQGLATWQANDLHRGFRNVLIGIDDAAALAPFDIKPIQGKVTAIRVKRIIDSLYRQLNPDYLILLGSGDVIPHFEVENPTLDSGGDHDALVPTDNPYACSRSYSGKKRESYLIPDRVIGRIPDLPGANDPALLLDLLRGAASWSSNPLGAYTADLLACCDQWSGSGNACAAALGRAGSVLDLSPPVDETTAAFISRHGSLLHMIKAHGAERDVRFYGQTGTHFPVLLASSGLAGAVQPGTVVGAMCCFGAGLFNPSALGALLPGQLPIPLVYLQQGAFGFGGSTNTAWVGIGEMLCADWIVVGFLKSVLGGASLGRALLEAKQEFVDWIAKQGRSPGLAEEKTLLQFLLLGDPAIHPVALPAGGIGPVAALAPAGMALAAGPGAASERSARRALRRNLGAALRNALPERRRLDAASQPPLDSPLAAARWIEAAAKTEDVARSAAAAAELQFDFTKAPVVHQVEGKKAAGPPPGLAAAVAAVAGPAPDNGPREVLEYYWSARRGAGRFTEIRIIQVVADKDGNVLRSTMVASC